MTDIGLVVRSANPIPADSQQLTEDELDAVLLLAQHRSGDMDTKERTDTVASPGSRGRNIAIAVGAFAVAVGAVAILVFAGGSTEGVPPATSPTDTATNAPVPELDAASVAYVEAFVAEVNEGDWQAAGERIASSQELGGSTFGENDLVFLTNAVHVATLLDTRFEIVECRTVNAGHTRCDIEEYSDHFPFAPVPMTAFIQLRIEDETLAFFWLEPIQDAWYPIALDWQTWLSENHPEDATVIINMADPVLAAERQKAVVVEYREQADPTG